MTTTLPTISTGPSPAPTTDSLKDLDALAFLRDQPADVRVVWRDRCRWLREVDRLSEADRWVLGQFLRSWRRSEYLRCVPDPLEPHAELIRNIGRAWAPASLFERDRSLEAWSCWLDALSADYGRATVPVTLEQHHRMVADVGGFFRLFPYLTPEQWESVGAFGALDQAWNNVRDLAEDAAAWRCYLPEEGLGRFRLSRHSVIGGSARRYRSWADFMTFWLGEHLPTLAARARPFLEVTDLHPSVEALRSSCLLRYARVERVLRGLEFDYGAFPEAYWAEVRRELGAQALGAKEIET
ncbi:squalene/phytoene synthase family protein [Sorangium sp. So ce388]|uniref:squalene/phytoene synthase family protein n=1 Tax=Sorangium sp. So ce388 TaxID=3133309 RepID=UPI003F5AE956